MELWRTVAIGLVIALCLVPSGYAGRRRGRNRERASAVSSSVDVSGVTADETNATAADDNATAPARQPKRPTVRPGFRARVTQHGFDYAAQFATDFLMVQMAKFKIPDVDKEVATSRVRLSDIHVAEFPEPTNKISLLPGQGLRWEVKDMEPTLKALYGAVVNMGFFSFTRDGNVTVEVKKMKFRLDFLIERDPEDGKPFVVTTNCTADGEVDISFEGGWDDMLNAGSSVFKTYIQEKISEQICSQASAEIDVNMQSELHTLPMREVVAELFELDFAFTDVPRFKKKFLETSHTGTVYYKEDPHEPPFKPSRIPSFNKHNKRMMYVYVTDYVVNSGLYAGFLSGQMTFNVTEDIHDMVPGDALGILRTSCEAPSICIGSVFPHLAEIYHPDVKAEADMYAVNPPVIKFSKGNRAQFYTFSEAAFYVKEGASRKHLFTAEVNLTSSVKINVENGKISFDIQGVTPSAAIKESSVGDVVAGMAFDELLKIGAERFIMRKMAAIAASGFELPSTDDVQFRNSELVPVRAKGLFVVATDIYINPDLDIQKMIEEHEAKKAAEKAADPDQENVNVAMD